MLLATSAYEFWEVWLSAVVVLLLSIYLQFLCVMEDKFNTITLRWGSFILATAALTYVFNLITITTVLNFRRWYWSQYINFFLICCSSVNNFVVEIIIIRSNHNYMSGSLWFYIIIHIFRVKFLLLLLLLLQIKRLAPIFLTAYILPRILNIWLVWVIISYTPTR